jgi:tRNA threonylcarbamoyladenosine modification (KEOPS) complex  Pcc1 subunit
MDVICELIIELENEEKVKTILKSVQVDDFNFVDSKIDGKKLKSTIKASSISSLLHTLDDYLSCISVAMNILDKD